MGVIIDQGISTDLGATETAYVNIQEYHISKSDILTLIIRLYTSKSSRSTHPTKVARHRNVPPKIKIILDDGDNDVTDTDILAFASCIITHPFQRPSKIQVMRIRRFD